MRERSNTPSPPRRCSPRGRSPSPRGRHGGRGKDLPTSLLVRNLPHDCRPDDLQRPFGRFGLLKDIYLPKDYHTGQPRGFGFIQYMDPADAEEAKYQMDGKILRGKELTVVFAEENRKKPSDMRARGGGRSRGYNRRKSLSRYSRSSPRRTSSNSRYHDYYSPPRHREYSRSASPRDRRYNPERSLRQRSREQSYSRSPPLNDSRSRSRSQTRERSQSPARSRIQNREDYERKDPSERSPSR